MRRSEYLSFSFRAAGCAVILALLAKAAASREPEVTVRTSDAAKQLLISPDGSVVASYARTFTPTATLWNANTGEKLGVLGEHSPSIYAMAFSPDGKTLATASGRESRIRLWDPQSGHELPSIDTGDAEPDCFVFSPDGSRILFNRDSEASLVEVETKRVICTLQGHAEHTNVNGLAFAPDGKRVATAGEDETVRIWDAATGRELQVIKSRGKWVKHVAFSPDGKLIAYCAASRAVLWDLEKAQEVGEVGIRNNGPVQFTSDGTWVVVSDGGIPLLINANNGQSGRISLGDTMRSCYAASVARAADLAVVHVSGPGGGAIGVLRNLTDEVFSSKVVGPGPNSNPVISDDGGVVAFFSAPGEVKIVDMHAAIKRVQSEKDAERRRELEKEQTKAAAEQMAADESAREQAAMAAATEHRARLAKPTWVDFEDLNGLLSGFPGGRDSALESFVRYGSPQLAEKAQKGDRFDREEADEAATAHQKNLGSRRFSLQSQYQWDDRESALAKKHTVRLCVPLGFRCLAPAHETKVGVAAFSEHALWFLTEDGKLRPCGNAQEARLVAESGGVLYAPEILGQSTLVLWVAGDRERLKTIARQPEQHVVNVGITGLRLERPDTEGFYKLDAIRRDDYTTGSLYVAFQNGLNGPKEQPNYFVTRQRSAVDDRSLPEVVSALVERVEVVNISGKDREVVFTWSRE